MPDPAGLLEVWRHEAPRTLRIVSVFTDVDLPYRPALSARSIGELCEYLASSYDLTRHWLVHDTQPFVAAPATTSSVAQAMQRIADAQARVFDLLANFPAERFFDVIAPFGVPEHRGVMALGMFKHELHYRGELYSLARVCGHEPPDLY
jgi:uncharacterized damage-inducible protein DinB